MPAKPVGSAGSESSVDVRRASGTVPTRGVSLPFTTMAVEPASSQPEDSPTTATGDDVLLRLALWLADVAADAALAATAGAPRRPGRSDDPPIAGSPS
jgi:hypothetical protein